jgi:hypothetical protein
VGCAIAQAEGIKDAAASTQAPRRVIVNVSVVMPRFGRGIQ